MNAPPAGKAQTPALADFILLNEEIAALVRARIPLESNLARLGKQLPRKSGVLAERIGQRMESGEDLVTAIDAECVSMPASYRAALVAGIQSGNLGAALKSIVDSASCMDQMRHVTLVALLYPLVLVVLVCWLLTFVIMRVMPEFAWIEHTPFRPILWLSHSPYTFPVLAIAAPCFIVLWANQWWWRSGRLGGSTPRLGLLATLTGSGRIYRWGEAARFAELLHLLVERGLPLDQSLQLVGEATGDRRLRAAAEQLAKEIQGGEVVRIANAQAAGQRQSDFPLLIRLALQHAGDRALLVASLRQAATMYQERTVRAAEWYSEYLPILLTIAIGGTFTIGFTLFVLWPYASMLHELSAWDWR
jgi:type II secretory pathway component PulF